MRFYYGLHFTPRGLRPYAGVNLGSWSPGKHTAQHVQKIVYHCSHCGAINPQTAKFCNKCGARFV
jgi:ribosomal protein L40E